MTAALGRGTIPCALTNSVLSRDSFSEPLDPSLALKPKTARDPEQAVALINLTMAIPTGNPNAQAAMAPTGRWAFALMSNAMRGAETKLAVA